nr:SulP family inorganic anion transporter [Kiloniellales bacterium]
IGAVVAKHGSAPFEALTAALAVMVGVFFLLFGLLRMGWVANFISTPVMKGFIQGLVWVTIIGQVPKLFGIDGGSGNFFEKTWDVVLKLPEANLTTTVIGLASLALLFAFARFLPRVPGALTTVVIAIAVVSVFGLGDRGVEIVGSVKAGLPPFGIPDVKLADLAAIVPGALAIVLLGYAESLGAAKAAQEKSGGEIDPDQELVSHGPANLGAGLSGGFIVVGSLSKTSVAMGAGGKTQLSSLINAGFVFLTLMFLMPLFENLPHATLGAIVIHAMLGLVDFGYLKRLRGISPQEFALAMTAFAGELIFGVLQGIGIGVILSIIALIYRASYPSTAVLGQIPGQEAYRDVKRHPEAQTLPGLLLFRFDSILFFANANHFADTLKSAVGTAVEPVKAVLVDAETVSAIDTTACDALIKLQSELAEQGIALAFARVRDPVRDVMQRSGVEAAVGAERFYERITDGVRAFDK